MARNIVSGGELFTEVANRLVVGFSDGPGARFGVLMLEALRPLPLEVHLVVSAAAKAKAARDTGLEPASLVALADRTYADANQAARISSGSFLTAGMVVVACSDHSLASIATGYGDDLLHRAADVTIKEARPLTILVRDVGAPDQVRRLAAVPWVEVHVLDQQSERSAEAADEAIRAILDRFVPLAPVVAPNRRATG